MTKILVTYDMFREGFTELESKYEVTFPEGRDFTYEEVLEMIPSMTCCARCSISR